MRACSHAQVCTRVHTHTPGSALEHLPYLVEADALSASAVSL